MSKNVNNISKALNAVRDALEKGVTKGSVIVETDATMNAPVDSGQLKQSITHHVNASGDKIEGIVGTNAEHAIFTEFGTGIYAENGGGRKTPWVYKKEGTGEWFTTSGQEPQPYLRPAFKNNKQSVEDVIKDELKKVRF